jgi:hypothetical protein
MPEKSILDARLAEIDRRLRAIQLGLAPAAGAAAAHREAHPPVVPPDAAPAPKRLSEAPGRDLTAASGGPPDLAQARDLVARLTALVKAHERLLSAGRELTDRREPADPAPFVSVSAGPFAGTEALRRFEGSLQALPEVRSAVVREYEGADRAIVDVHLREPTP